MSFFSFSFHDAAPTERVTSTVDAEVARSFLRDAESIDVLKIDVQGAELVVLEGATETLARTLFVHHSVRQSPVADTAGFRSHGRIDFKTNADGATGGQKEDLRHRHTH